MTYSGSFPPNPVTGQRVMRSDAGAPSGVGEYVYINGAWLFIGPGGGGGAVSSVTGANGITATPTTGAVVVEPTTYDSVTAVDNPVHYYTMNEASGTTMIDTGSSPVNGTYSGTVNYQSSMRMKDGSTGIRFDGSSTIATLGAITAPAFPFTIEWVMLVAQTPSTMVSGGMDVWGNLNAGITTGLIASLGTGTGVVSLGVGSGSGLATASSGSFMSATYQPIHCVMIADGSNLFGYVNNVIMSKTPVTVMSFGTQAIVIGNRVNSSTKYWFDGCLAKFAIYNAALSYARVSAHCNAM